MEKYLKTAEYHRTPSQRHEKAKEKIESLKSENSSQYIRMKR
jgi:hypothetical protein